MNDSDDFERAELAVPVNEHDHIQGRANALLTLVEYGDFECPACGQAHSLIKKLQRAGGDQLRFVFRHFPLVEMHAYAEHAAEAAESAATKGKFWEMHDLLFENQNALAEEDLAEFAVELGLDPRSLLHDVEQERFASRIRADYSSGLKSGVDGTPTFFINGMRYDGDDDLESMLEALEQAAHTRFHHA
jgi:protein-disulfide isomerase